MHKIDYRELVYSNKWSIRLMRHFLFWFCWWVYFALLHAANPFGKPEISYFRNLPFTITESVFHMFPQMIITYVILYVAFPLFMKRKIVLGFVVFAATYLLVASINLYMTFNVNPKILEFILPEEYMRYTSRPEGVSFFMSLMSTFKGGLITPAMAVGVKAMKNWKLREERNLQLMREKADAQLQLLTAQIHPHFLFNTLNNIYSQTQLESPKGSSMIMELSDLLRYILYEGRKSQVPLDHELQMMVDYINLEKIRYGNSLQLHLDLPENSNNLYISPLLLLPFIENCFKHGASKQLHTPWINLSILVEGGMMRMELCNGKVPGNEEKTTGGIGIGNVVNRLKLLYPDEHNLTIEETKEAFLVKLELKLKQGLTLSNQQSQVSFYESVSYAS